MNSILTDKNGNPLFVGDWLDCGHSNEQIKSIKENSENGFTKITLTITNSILGGVSTIDFPLSHGESSVQAKLYEKITF